MKPDLRTALRSRVIVGDGAMGTYLHQLGVPVGISHEELNVTNPDIIGDVHRQYIDAGAEAVETNTYSAQRWKLEKYGLGGKAEGINAAGAAVARKAAGSRAWVLGAVGPFRTGPGRTAPGANVRRRDYEEQLGALLGAGVDGLILETFYDLEELSLVLRLARKRSDLPVICQFAVEDPARTPDGVPLAEAFRRLIGEGADVVGLNCRGGPSAMIRAFAELPRLGVPFSVFPNAGLPDYVDGRVVFSAPPEYFGETARTFADLGVRLIGGCCGTTPAHIAAVAAALKEYAPEAGLADTGPDAERADTPADVSADAALREKRQDAKTDGSEIRPRRHGPHPDGRSRRRRGRIGAGRSPGGRRTGRPWAGWPRTFGTRADPRGTGPPAPYGHRGAGSAARPGSHPLHGGRRGLERRAGGRPHDGGQFAGRFENEQHGGRHAGKGAHRHPAAGAHRLPRPQPDRHPVAHAGPARVWGSTTCWR